MRLFSFILIFAFACPSLAAEKQAAPAQKSSDSYLLELGLSATVGLLEVREKGGGTTFGKMISNLTPLPIISLASPHKAVGGSRFSYNFKFSLFWEKFSRQRVGLVDVHTVDEGTSVKTFSAFLLPVLSYSVDNLHLLGGSDQRLTFGGGFGAGYFDADGEVKLTEQTGTPVQTISIHQFSFAGYVMVDFYWNRFDMAFDAGGPLLNKDQFNYALAELAFRFSYTFPINW